MISRCAFVKLEVFSDEQRGMLDNLLLSPGHIAKALSEACISEYWSNG